MCVSALSCPVLSSSIASVSTILSTGTQLVFAVVDDDDDDNDDSYYIYM